MSAILGILLFSSILSLVPFFVVGWLFKGWRPFSMATVLCILSFFVFHKWTFGWLFLPFGYFLALCGYIAGGQVRTGKSQSELMEGKPTESLMKKYSSGE